MTLATLLGLRFISTKISVKKELEQEREKVTEALNGYHAAEEEGKARDRDRLKHTRELLTAAEEAVSLIKKGK